MSDYYTINTVGLPSCMRASNLNLTNFFKVSVNLLMPAIHNPKYKNKTSERLNFKTTIYGFIKFCSQLNFYLTWCRQIIYLVITYLPHNLNKLLTLKNFKCSNFVHLNWNQFLIMRNKYEI